jgi:hypothetical protein
MNQALYAHMNNKRKMKKKQKTKNKKRAGGVVQGVGLSSSPKYDKKKKKSIKYLLHCS